MRGDQTPQATRMRSVAISPFVVCTLTIRPSSTSMPVTSVLGDTVRAPLASADSRIIVPARTESTTPTVGVQKPPTMTSGSRKGTLSAISAGVTSCDSMPQARAEAMRRASSCIRSSVRATSKPPDSVKTPSSLYWRMLSRVRSVISREWSTGKMKFDAWPVEPPGFGRGPLSTWTMSFQPSSARWWTRLLPTMPAPTTTTLAWVGTEAMAGSSLKASSPCTVAYRATGCAMRNFVP